MKYLCFALVVACFLFGANANILARKSFDPEVLVAQHPNTITVTLFNIGDAPVFDVSVNDTTWGEGWTVKSVELTAKFCRIYAGSNVSFSYFINNRSRISGNFGIRYYHHNDNLFYSPIRIENTFYTSNNFDFHGLNQLENLNIFSGKQLRLFGNLSFNYAFF